jgi:hypothetical protein
MPIAVTCAGCGKILNVKDEYLGRNLKCPQCGVTFTAELPPDHSAQKNVDKVLAQWPAVAGIGLLVLGLILLWLFRNAEGAGMFRRFALGVMGLGIASLGYWAFNSSNRDYNF